MSLQILVLLLSADGNVLFWYSVYLKVCTYGYPSTMCFHLLIAMHILELMLAKPGNARAVTLKIFLADLFPR